VAGPGTPPTGFLRRPFWESWEGAGHILALLTPRCRFGKHDPPPVPFGKKPPCPGRTPPDLPRGGPDRPPAGGEDRSGPGSGGGLGGGLATRSPPPLARRRRAPRGWRPSDSGGFPESFLAPDDRTSLRWQQDFLRAYVEREIPLLGGRLPGETLRCLADLESLPGVPPGPVGPPAPGVLHGLPGEEGFFPLMRALWSGTPDLPG